jgi:hypothetical protein
VISHALPDALRHHVQLHPGFQQSQGDNSFPWTQLDSDLAGLQESVGSLGTFVQSVMRSDGALKNGIVTYDSLAPALLTAGLAPATAWAMGTTYLLGISVTINSNLYRCLVPHTSGVFATDLAAGDWVFVAALQAGPQGSAGTNGVGYGGTSATSLAITNNATEVFVTQAGLAYQVGSYIRASSAANGQNYMEGFVSVYAGTSLSIAVKSVGGTGTFADWRFTVAASPGTVDASAIQTGGRECLGKGRVATGVRLLWRSHPRRVGPIV